SRTTCPCFVLGAWCHARCQVPGASCGLPSRTPREVFQPAAQTSRDSIPPGARPLMLHPIALAGVIMFTRRALAFMLLLCTATPVLAQEQPDPRTLIPQETLNALAQHISGAQALHNVMEMCPYERNRAPEEYAGTYREAAYAEAKAKEYGFADVHIERFPLGTRQWDGEMAELWVTEPGPPQLITSYRDI